MTKPEVNSLSNGHGNQIEVNILLQLMKGGQAV
jgi:hypothetical protein